MTAPASQLDVLRPISLSQPPHLSFGAGCVANCIANILGRNLKKVFLLTTPPVLAHAERFLAELKAKGVTTQIHTDVPPEPSVTDFEKILTQARGFHPDCVVGFGGGSVLDVAKLVAALHDHPESVRKYFGIGLLPGRSTYMVCIPTTAGTGSEVSPNAILLDEAENLKKGVISPFLMPDAAYVDPLLTLSVPPSVTAATGIDAMVHCIEAYANKFAHALIDPLALQGVRLISANLPTAVRDGSNVEARSAVAMGSMLGGMCLGPVNTAAVHALSYPLGSEFHMAHGLSNALLLAPVLRFNLPAAPRRYADIALALGVTPGATDLETAERGIARIEALCRECGITKKISDYGVPVTAIPGMALSAMKVTRLLKNNPRELTAADAEAIYRNAF